MRRETKLILRTSETEGHEHEVYVPEGPIASGYYETNTVDGHWHDVRLEEPLEPGQVVNVVTSGAYGPDRNDRHAHEVEVSAVEDEEPEEEGEREGRVEAGARRDRIEVKVARGGSIETKQSERNGVSVGIVAGYLSTWDPDTGGIFGVPDQFVRGAWAASLADHRRRGNRQIRLKDHHGRTIGGFPIETAREDDHGLYAVGEVNLEVSHGREAFALARQGVLTDFSVGYSPVNDTIDGGVRLIREAHLWEASIVDEPANQRANILEVKAVVPFQDLPLADRDRRWDSTAAINRVRRFTDSTESPSRAYRRAFVWFDRANADDFQSYKLPIADVVGGDLVVVPRAVFAAAAAVRGARGGVDLPDEDRRRVIRHLERYYAKMDEPSPFDREERQFFGVEEVKTLDAVALERAFRESGAFSKGASRELASRLAPGVRYAGSEGLGEILADLVETKKILVG